LVPEPGRSIVPDQDGGSPHLDVRKAHPARVYDCWLGGQDNFAADREVAAQTAAIYPGIIRGVQAQRACLAALVKYLAAEQGICQFLDIGTGLPTANNTHEVAQRAVPTSRVVYVDNDPVVLAHARALLRSTPEGETAYVEADLRDTADIVAGAARILDFSQPVGVILFGILQLIPDGDHPHASVRRILAAVPSGSYLGVVHPASDIHADRVAAMTNRYNRLVDRPATLRSHTEISRFFDGTELIEPGLVQVHRWQPGAVAPDPGADLAAYCGLGRKP
jgi:hypothetical protein